MPSCAELNLPIDRTRSRRSGGISATFLNQFLNQFEVQRIATPKDQRIIGIFAHQSVCVHSSYSDNPTLSFSLVLNVHIRPTPLQSC